MQRNTLTTALEYAELGFRVLPLKPGTKVPDLRHWPEEASSTPETIRQHFELAQRRNGGKQPNVGICTGGGLAVVDVDTHHGGEIPSWVDTETAAVRTPSGGLHFYYAVEGFVPNSVGRLAPGVDIRGERGQVAAPPSVIHRPGALPHDIVGRYTWINDLPIAKISGDLLTPDDLKVDYFGRATRRSFEYRDEVPVGERNNYLTSLAGFLFADGQTFHEVLQALETEVESLGFSPSPGEVRKIVHSVARYH